jgi:predicted membrane channel-forming protein YqfA (hemolysin III family)
MNDTLLYTLPQWFIFAAAFAVVYGWIEDKKTFRIIGAVIFILLGIFSLIILSGDYFATNRFLTPGEVANKAIDNEIVDEIPFQAKLFPAYLSFVLSAALALPAIFFDYKNSKKYRWFIILSGLVALFGFFVIVGAVKAL